MLDCDGLDVRARVWLQDPSSMRDQSWVVYRDNHTAAVPMCWYAAVALHRPVQLDYSC